VTRIAGIAVSMLAASLAHGQDPPAITGRWTVAGPVLLDRVPLKFFTAPNNSSESPLPASQFRVPLDLVREAGTLHLEGSLQNGSGGGNFTFTPDPTFAPAMRSLGIAGLTDHTMYVLAVHDVGATYVRELNGLGVQPRSANQLIGMAVQHVSLEYVREFYALGYASLSADMLISMRVQGVSAEFVKEIEALGFPHPPVDQLISMRVQGVTPEYIRKARAAGLQNLSLDQIVNLKIQGIVE
jgi:hypothetical protein